MYIYTVINWTGILQHFEIRIHKKKSHPRFKVWIVNHTRSRWCFMTCRRQKGSIVYHTPWSEKVTKVVSTHTCQMSVGWQCLFVCEWLRRIEGRWEQIRSEPPCASLCMVSSTYIVQTNGWCMCGELNYPWRYVSFFGKLSMTKYSLLNSWGKEIGRGR